MEGKAKLLVGTSKGEVVSATSVVRSTDVSEILEEAGKVSESLGGSSANYLFVGISAPTFF